MKRQFFRTFVSGGAKVSVGDGNPPKDASSFDPEVLAASTGNKEVDALLLSLSGVVGSLDKKLNAIQERLNEVENAENHLYDCRTIDISGNGIKLEMGSEVEIGEVLYVTIDLFGCGKPRFEAYGKVVRVDKLVGEKGDLYHAGIEFIDLEEKKREQLINFTFKQQRKYIRAFADNTDKKNEETAD